MLSENSSPSVIIVRRFPGFGRHAFRPPCYAKALRSGEQPRHVIPLHAAAFDPHDDFAPLILGLVDIQQTVHAAIRAFAGAFLERSGVNERERPMLEWELVQFRLGKLF